MDTNTLAPTSAIPILTSGSLLFQNETWDAIHGPNCLKLALCRIKLLAMQQAAAESSVSASSFASFLASLAAPPQSAGPEWNDDLLSDDVATLSYEQPLRTHGQDTPPADRQPAPGSESGQSRPERGLSTSPDRSVKRASITIRLTEPEAAQLRGRAVEAGLTVSAYLRSCVLEVESLRTQVKQTLAQLRESAPAPPPPLPSKQKPWLHFWSRRADAPDRR